jgi:hypothetical protein
MFLGSQHFGGRGVCWSSEMRLGKMTSDQSLTHAYTKPNNKLVSAWLEHFWCKDKPWVNSDSQDSPRLGLGGSHHLPLIVYYVHGHGIGIQMAFCHGTPKWEF